MALFFVLKLRESKKSSTFAVVMKHSSLHTAILGLCLCFAMQAAAEVVYLKAGGHREGTIVFRNEEVVVLKDAGGARYQYLMSDVDRIVDAIEPEPEVEDNVQVRAYGKKVAVGISVAGGASVLTRDYVGGAVQADLLVGSTNLLDRNIFLGGGLGYHAAIMKDKKDASQLWSFLPIQLRAEVPMMQGKHAPMVGLGVGYGVSLTKAIKGGLFAEAQLGWRYQMNAVNHLFLGAYASFQNAKINGLEEQIQDITYIDDSNRNIFSVGAKLTIYL